MKFLTVHDVAGLLRVSPDTIYELARRGKLPGRKIGRAWRFSGEALEAYVAGGASERRGRTSDGSRER
jgi:excisionase family DNA binding protein